MRGLYVHVPFCVRKCAYCDFYSLPGRLDSIEAYVSAVVQEARAHPGLSFQTLYLGGGTPSLLGPAHLQRLVSDLRETLDLSSLLETTVEANPESATRGFLEAARDSGITRVSIGVQSLSDDELKSAGRVHTAKRAVQAVKLAKSLGFTSVSADVIIGLPGQTWGSLGGALETLIGLGVQHLSVYCLALEEDTPLAQSPPANLPSDDAQAELFEHARTFLAAQGFSHYEISNFALPGHECRHNLNYWRGGEYLGLGPAAASHLGGRRYKNHPALDAYLQDPLGQTVDVETLGAEDKAAEEAMLRLRLLVEGVETRELAGRFGPDTIAALIHRLDGMAERGLLEIDGTRYVLAPSRVLTSNPVFQEVLGLQRA